MANPLNNELLATLPEVIYRRLLPDLQLVSLVASEVLHGPGDRIEKVYFPITALISLSKELSAGTAMDTALIGAESMVGVRGLVGPSVHRVYVSASGLAYQLRIEVLRRELEAHQAVRMLCWKTADHVSSMMVTEASCSRFHTIDQRVAKWILMRLDRKVPQPIVATHQAIADALGVRREAVTLSLAKLDGVVLHRGSVEVVDRACLERACCECYASQRALGAHQLTLPFQSSGQPA